MVAILTGVRWNQGDFDLHFLLWPGMVSIFSGNFLVI
jgi:hypothetical protein